MTRPRRTFWRPPAPVAVTQAPATPAPSADELTALVVRFSLERAPLHPEEAIAWASWVIGLAAAIAPPYARLVATLQPPAEDGAVN